MNIEELKDNSIAYKWRVQSSAYGKCRCVAYIDARTAHDLLDKVCGPMNWQTRYEEHKGNLFCSIGILGNKGWVWKTDCGTESNTEKQKGEASDAFKRAAVLWGIARFLYSLPIIPLPAKEENGKLKPYHLTKGFIRKAEDITKWCNSEYNKTK